MTLLVNKAWLDGRNNKQLKEQVGIHIFADHYNLNGIQQAVGLRWSY